MVGVAQLVERRIVIPVVVGSIPIVDPISFCNSKHIRISTSAFAKILRLLIYVFWILITLVLLPHDKKCKDVQCIGQVAEWSKALAWKAGSR